MGTHETWMEQAFHEAEKAFEKDEVPVGAIVIEHDHIIGRGHNQVESLQDPTAHAEIIAITAAANSRSSWRLEKTTLYVTKEPCPMCAGALVNARLDRLVFGALDEQAGCAGSLYQLCRDPRFNHQLEVAGGLLEERCQSLLKAFFAKTRTAGGAA